MACSPKPLVAVRRFFLVLSLSLSCTTLPAVAQEEATPQKVDKLDLQIFYGVYDRDSAFMEAYMRGFDATAYPIYYGAPLLTWGGAWLTRGSKGDSWDDAYRFTLTWVSSVAVVMSLKRMVKRPRPYAALADVQARSARHQGERVLDPHSFPSGHSMLAFAIATSWSLSQQRWYVVVPSALWATSVALSRVWLGVHYPSDILVGAVLGGGIATVVHLLGDALTPAFLRDEDGGGAPAPMRLPSLRLRF